MKKIRSYVLRQKRPTNLQARALEAHRDTYCIPYSSQDSGELERFLIEKPTVLEIGFGMGEVTASFAQHNPDKHVLGIEVFLPGVGKLLHEVHARNLDNVRIIIHDAVEVINDMLIQECLAGVHIFFPDPWPKKRHHKRRLVQKPFLESLIPLLVPGGYIYMATDWEEYAHHMLEVCEAVDALVNPSKGFCEPQSWRPMTKFERKGLNQNHVIRELLVLKK